MPIHIHWEDDSRNLLRLTFDGNWTLDDLLMVGADAADQLAAVEHRVDLILDFSRTSTRIPQNLPTLIPQLKDKDVPNRGIILVVAAPMPVRTFVGMLQGIVPDAVADLYFMDSLREAYLLLEKPVPDAQTRYPVAG
jgi:hypothetical protein